MLNKFGFDFMNSSEEIICEETSNSDIAVIGLSGEIGGAKNISDFWNMISSKTDCIKDFPSNRKEDIDNYIETVFPTESSVKYAQGAYLPEIDKFDYKFFGISPKEASLMDPNQRLFLQTAWNVIEDAGYDTKKLRGTKTGVFIGHSSLSAFDYKRIVSDLAPSAYTIALAGNLAPIIASRISYILDFKGPSLMVDTACSSSLVAVHLACQSIRKGECSYAIAGGVKINFLPLEFEDKIGIESSDGRTKAFDDSSDGTGSGEGVAAVLLKPLNKAIDDGDHIYAVIKGSAINQDGASIGITAPNALAQEEVIVSAWEDAGIDPETVIYIEAHGTGTRLGDPIEIEGITRAFKRYSDKKQFCAVGALKTNIGHLDNLSGIAGLVKAILALKNKAIPPNLHFNCPNMNIDFESSPVYINTRLSEFDTNSDVRRCGVSSFGLSGTNCHVVLEEYTGDGKSVGQYNEEPSIFTLSAKTENSLKDLIMEYRNFTYGAENTLQDICYTASVGREHYDYRLAFVSKNKTDFISTLQNIDLEVLEKNTGSGVYYSKKALGDEKQVLENDVIELLKVYAKSKDEHILHKLCLAYVNGEAVDWINIYRNRGAKKVSLPVYQFEKMRCWIKPDDAVKAKKEQGNFSSLLTNKNISSDLKDQLKTILDKCSIELKVNGDGSHSKTSIVLTGKEGVGYTAVETEVANIWGAVLGLEQLSVTDNYYDLGGDSLLASKILNQINKHIVDGISIVDILKNQTVLELAAFLDVKIAEKNKDCNAYYPIKRIEDDVFYKVSSAQKRMVILAQIEGSSSTAYNITQGVTIEGVIDIERLQNAFNELIKRHEIFRTVFELIDGEPVQRILESTDFQLGYMEADENDIQKILSEFIRPFDISQSPLIRACLVKNSENRYILFMDMHHIISDGTSMGIISKEIISLYNGYVLDENNIRYRDYAAWQNMKLDSGSLRKQEEYWLNELSGEIPTLNLPTDFHRPLKQSFEGNSTMFELDNEGTEAIKNLAKNEDATIYIMLLSIYNVLISRYSGQQDIVVGTPIAARNHPDLENIIGLFVNTLAMRNYPEGTKTFRDFLAEVKEKSLKAYENQDYQLEDLIGKLELKRDTGRNPLFDTLFVLQNTGAPISEANGVRFIPYEIGGNTSKFDLTLNAYESNSGNLKFQFEYCTKLFKEDTIRRMSQHFLKIVETVVNNPETRLCDINIICGAEEDALSSFNDTCSEYSRELTLNQLFEMQVQRTPEKPAVSYLGREYTYKELNEKANRLARTLRKKSISNEIIVGILLERSYQAIVSILAVLKAGGAILPIDTQYPTERIRYMLEDSQAKILITEGDLSPLIKELDYAGEIIDVEDMDIYDEDTSDLECMNSPQSLLYIIYTSGTTGRPKGVALEHKNLVNLIEFEYKNTNIDFTNKVLQFTTIGFDVCYQEIFSTLLAGAVLYIVCSENRKNVSQLFSFIKENDIRTIFFPTSYLKFMANEKEYLDEFPECIRHIITAGEQLVIPRMFADFLREKKIYLHNHYGPSETHVVTTCTLDPEENIPDIPTIGKPISNTRIHILNESFLMQPIGVPGELYISGDSVGRGYLNRQELTSERFITKKDRMYRTGDLAKWLPDGNIEFLGRLDHQVKIRGFRVELGEIEFCLMNNGNIKEAVVLVKKDKTGSDFLCAYYVPIYDNLSKQEIKDFLLKSIPDYMVPAHFIKMDKLPLNTNGKVDRKMLPEPDMESEVIEKNYVEPKDDVEWKIVKAWQQVLRIEKVGTTDNFFDLGGDSLRGIKLVSILLKEFEININDIFQYQTIQKLAKNIAFKKDNLKNSLDRVMNDMGKDWNEIYNSESVQVKLKDYRARIEQYKDITAISGKKYSDILLTGATGYFGIYLLRELLEKTSANIYVIIRGKTIEDSTLRLQEKWQYYFEDCVEIPECFRNRTVILNGDITQNRLGLEQNMFDDLCSKIDCVINSAANVKHYGRYEEFYNVNVESVEKLIQFALINKKKDLHHVSTTGIAAGHIKNTENVLFTENDFDIGQELGYFYPKTKLIAEKLVVEARDKGLKTNVYRMGNLVFNSKTGKFQENIKDNAFYSMIRAFIKTRTFPHMIQKTIDFSFVDCAAKAFVLLLNAEGLENESFNLFNSKRVSFEEIGNYVKENGFNTEILSIEEYAQYLYENYDNPKYKESINDILVHSHALEAIGTTNFIITGEKTESILENNGFKWAEVTAEHIKRMLEYCIGIGFIEK